MKKISNEELNKRLFDKFRDEYIVVGTYKGVDHPVAVKHCKCDTTFDLIFSNLRTSKGCPKCNPRFSNKRKSKEDIQKDLDEKYPGQYTILEYERAESDFKAKIIHNFYLNKKNEKIPCGHTDNINLINLLRRRSDVSYCKFCKRKKPHIKAMTQNTYNSMCCVYKHENKTTGKVYVGITNQYFKDRWQLGRGYLTAENGAFKNAINKYGWDNFKHYILLNDKWIEVLESEKTLKYHVFNFKKACELESKYIRTYRSKLGKKNVYNVSDGGEGTPGVNEKPVLQYSLAGVFIKRYESVKEASIMNNINRAALSAAIKKHGQSHGFLWKFDDGTDLVIPKRIAFINIGVVQYDLEGNKIREYKNAVIASKETGISAGSISSACRGKPKVCGGYQWRHKNSSLPIGKIEKPKINNYPVYQFNLNGEFIKKYRSAAIAIKETGIQTITNCCNGTQDVAGGYIWTRDKENVSQILLNIQTKKDSRQQLKKVLEFNHKKELITKYDSVIACARALNLDRNSVARRCEGKSNPNDGKILIFESDYSYELLTQRIIAAEKPKNGEKAIVRSDGVVFTSATEAAKKMSISKNSINNVLRKRPSAKTAGGYGWKYLDE